MLRISEGVVSKKINVELKAWVPSLKGLASSLINLGGRRIGSFRQIDTYFAAPKGRLKIREMDHGGSQLVYYLRKNSRGPKVSNVYLTFLSEPDIVKSILSMILGVKSVVKKRRQIFRIKGVQVHLDHVDGLGSFIEFEKVVKAEDSEISEARKQLERLLSALGIPRENLQTSSYGELVSRDKVANPYLL